MNEVERNPLSALQVDVSRDGVVATVTVTGELDITTAPSLTRRLLEVGAAHPDRLVLDLSGLVLVDVAGARALDEAHALLQAGCPVILRTPRPSARKFLGLAGRMEGLEQSPPRSVAVPRHLSRSEAIPGLTLRCCSRIASAHDIHPPDPGCRYARPVRRAVEPRRS